MSLQQAIRVDFRHCVLADTDALIAADPCDRWVLRFETEYADHIAINQAARRYIDDIRAKHADRARAEYDRCRGIPPPPSPPPPPAVRFSIAVKGVPSGGASGRNNGMQHAQIVRFGAAVATSAKCSLVPRTVFCRPTLTVFVRGIDQWEVEKKGGNLSDGAFFTNHNLGIIGLVANARFDGQWATFVHNPQERYGNSLVAKERIHNDSIVFRSRPPGGLYDIWPDIRFHHAMEARRREDGAVLTTGELREVIDGAGSSNGLSDFSRDISGQFRFRSGHSGVWDFYCVPIIALLNEPHNYHYENGGGLDLTVGASWNTSGLATYSVGSAAGKKLYNNIIMMIDEDFACSLKGVGVVTKYIESDRKILGCAQSCRITIPANPMGIPIRGEASASSSWEARYIDLSQPAYGEQKTSENMTLDLLPDSKRRVEDGESPRELWEIWVGGSGASIMQRPFPARAPIDHTEVDYFFPPVIGYYYSTMMFLGHTIPVFESFAINGARAVYFKMVRNRDNMPVLGVAGIMSSVLYSAKYGVNGPGQRYYVDRTDFVGLRKYDDAVHTFLNLSTSECLAAVTDACIAYVAQNYPGYSFVALAGQTYLSDEVYQDRFFIGPSPAGKFRMGA